VAVTSLALGALNDPVRDTDLGAPVSAAAEALLAAVARTRDRKAFAQLFRQYAPRIKSFLLSRGVLPDAAEEVVQEIMLIIWRRADQYDPARGAARAWIFTITRNCLVDRVRATRRPEVDLDDPALVVDPPTGEMQLLQGEDHRALVSAIDRLPGEQMDVLRGTYFRGRSLKDMAAEQKVPLGTVKTRLRLALKHLRDRLRTPEARS
jgi:RNA polymerase sigma-70 factor (ECF subfamily)